jgi:hypothetical protein
MSMIKFFKLKKSKNKKKRSYLTHLISNKELNNKIKLKKIKNQPVEHQLQKLGKELKNPLEKEELRKQKQPLLLKQEELVVQREVNQKNDDF